MTHRVRVGTDGRLEVVRTAPPEDPRRLRRTGEALRAAADAGAVEVRSITDTGEEVEVVLAYAGRAPVAPLAAPLLARVGATLAARLADLHARGAAHGALEIDHVLLDADGVPRLCGFGHADDATAPDDVRALGELLLALLDPDDHSAEAEAVRATAARCTAPDPTGRPAMAAVAASLAPITAPARRPSPRQHPTRSRRRAAVVVALVLSLAVGAVAVAAARPSAPARARVTTSTASSTTIATTTPPRATRVWPPADPHELDANGARWSFGTVDDHVALGDWDCNGTATPALVERGGRVWVIDAWPDGDRATARFVGDIGASVAAIDVEREASCDVLVVSLVAGGRVRPTLRPGA